jgi:imidazolonepropionase-like amidohydrolase
VVVPGMLDCHFHAYGVGLGLLDIESLPASYVAVRATQRLGAALRRGFTTVRDVAGGDAGLGRAVHEGRFPSPRYLYTGPALSQTGGHGDPHPGDAELHAGCCHMAEVVDGVEPLRVAVRRRLRGGAHAVKVLASGGVVSPTDPLRNPQYSADEIAAVCDEAARRGSYVAAHAYSPEAIVHAVTNGVRSVEHGNLLDADTAALMARHDAVLVPTLATYDAMDRRGAQLGLPPAAQAKNREVLAAGQDAVRIADDAGVTIGFGTDLMGDLEDEQLQGLRLQVEAQGVLGALRAVTSGNAAVVRRDDLGRIGPGAVGDLVVLDGDPFDDPAVLWGPHRTVVQAGRVVA